ncbi:MAG: nucleotidyl transferase AbiEii/AbiGii toxin family protein [Deltaproteobacteria bacterium]
MTIGRLTKLQTLALEILSTLRPPWTLTGGAAMAGFHTQHRTTRDLDLFFRPQPTLGDVVTSARSALEANGLTATVLRSTPSFAQLDVRSEDEAVVIDLVADPTPIAEEPRPTQLGTSTILVETPHQLLVNKLCALLSRSELRDLVDVQVLIAAGGNISRALHDCPDQDAGFSPLSFGWCVRGLDLARLGKAVGLSSAQIDDLDRFRTELIDRVLAAAKPST